MVETGRWVTAADALPFARGRPPLAPQRYTPAVRSPRAVPVDWGRTRARPRWRTGLSVLLVLPMSGCGGSATPTPVATSSPTPSVAPSPSVEPSAEPTPSPARTASPTAAQPTTFESVVYPYNLTLPAGVIRRQWRAATIPWDGQTPIRRQNPSIDLNGTPLGDLAVWGFPWTADPAGLGALVEDNTSRFNGCRRTSEPTELEVNGVPGVSYSQVCVEGLTALTAVLVKDDYGLIFRVVEYTAPEEDVLEQLTEWMAGATWPVSR